MNKSNVVGGPANVLSTGTDDLDNLLDSGIKSFRHVCADLSPQNIQQLQMVVGPILQGFFTNTYGAHMDATGEIHKIALDVDINRVSRQARRKEAKDTLREVHQDFQEFREILAPVDTQLRRALTLSERMVAATTIGLYSAYMVGEDVTQIRQKQLAVYGMMMQVLFPTQQDLDRLNSPAHQGGAAQGHAGTTPGQTNAGPTFRTYSNGKDNPGM
jgi:hypothetical protein